MSNQQLIKSAHIWFLVALLVGGVLAIAGKGGSVARDQNSNQNSNSNSNANQNTKNRNDNRSGNSNSGMTGATGERAGMSSQDQKFVIDAVMGGMMEVQLGRWAAQKGTSDAVKQFGRRMVDDHTKANSELTTLASTKGITLPTELDAKHQAQVTKIVRLSGADFDRAYSKMMLSDHTKDVSEFEKYSTKGADADIKAFATSTLPTLQEHLQLAKALPGNERGNSNSNSNSNSNTGGSKNSNKNSNGNGNSNKP